MSPTAAAINFSDIRLVPLKAPNDARKEDVNLKAGTYLAGTVIGELPSAPGTFGPYNSTNSSSTTNAGAPTMLLEYGCVVDTNGVVWFGDTSGSSEWGQGNKHASAFRVGLFSVADLVGLDADVISKMGRIVKGNSTAGEFMVTGA